MKRSNFVRTLTAGAVGAAVLKHSESKASFKPAKVKEVLMKVGCQSGGTTTENLELKSRCGVYNIDGNWQKTIPGKGWDLEDSLKKREACEKYEISLDAYHWPLSSAGIYKVDHPNIMLGKSP